jgi:hypothetical protein
VPDISNIPAFLLAFITLLLTVGGFFVLRQGYAKQAAEVEDRVIKALNVEIATQERKIKALEKDLDRLRRILDTIRNILNRRGWKITIDGEIVTLEDNTGKSNITRIQDRIPKSTTPGDDDDSDVS